MEQNACQNCINPFTIFPEDLEFYQKIKVPPPTFCPDCRMIRRFLWWNGRNLYRRKDDASRKEIFSGIPAGAPVKVYERNYWWSDAWEPMDYGRPYDFSRPFFEQFRDLMLAVPWPSRDVVNLVNSDYCNNSAGLKNCYLCFNLSDSTDSAYTDDAAQMRSSFDVTGGEHTELSYESVEVYKCYHAFFSAFCEECRDIWFSFDCSGCSNCFGCVNLRNKEYYIFNQPYTREEYFEKLKSFRLDSTRGLTEAKEKVREFWTRYPHEHLHGWHNTSVSGEFINESKHVHASYSITDGEKIKYSQFIWGGRDSYDYTAFGEKSELIHEALLCGDGCSSVKFSFNCWPADMNVEYSMSCGSSSDLFGCVGLRKKQYCILNKQYTREEYFVLREKIIRHMNEMPYVSKIRNPKSEIRNAEYRYGEFFPPEFSPFAYNETVAQDFFPLSREEAEARGYAVRDAAPRSHETTVGADDLPDRIEDVSDSVVGDIIRCSSCGLPYRIIQMEFEFYRKAPLPLPRLCPACRLRARFGFRNPPRYWHRKCHCAGRASDNGAYQNAVEHFHGWDHHCPEEFETSYSPARPEIVFCQRCYNVEAVG